MAIDSAACLWYYGDPKSPEFEAKHMVLYVFPEWMRKIFPRYQHQEVRKAWLNRDCVQALEAVFAELLSTGLYKELKTYDGAWNIRPKRGMSEYSIHSWAIALDFNAETNPLGGKVTFSQAYLNVWRKHGWTVGADFGNGRSDGMHKEFSQKAIEAYKAHLEAQKPKPKAAPKPAVKPTPPKEVPKPSPVAPIEPKKVELMDFVTPTFLPKTLPTK